ncbi:MAG TPA: hypothetical protein VMD79_03385 [Solirubrobacteraceae bacterium]|nr:hypothetical protein [Solirubrobacteraceae bacterium]
MATSGEKKWPRMGRSRWPLTVKGRLQILYRRLEVDAATAAVREAMRRRMIE